MDEPAHLTFDALNTALKAAGIAPTMAEATARRQDWETTLRASGRLTGPRPTSVDALLSLLVR